MSAGTTISRTFSSILKESIHKPRLLKGGGRGGQKCRNLLSKKTTRGEGGGHKIGKMGRRCLWIAPKIADVATFYDCSLKNVQTNNGTYGLKEPKIGLECTLSLMFGHISHCALLYLFFHVTNRTLQSGLKSAM